VLDKQSLALREIIDVIANSIDFESKHKDIYSAAIKCLQSVLGIDRASITFLDSDGVMRFKAWRGISDHYRKVMEGYTPWLPSVRDPRPVTVCEVQKEVTLSKFLSTFEKENIRALVFIPMVYLGRLLGEVTLYSENPYHFNGEIEFALALGKIIAFGIVQSKKEEELRSSEDLFRATFDLSAIGMILLSASDGRFTRVNAKFSEMIGYSNEELKTMTFSDITYPDDREESDNAFRKLSGGLPIYSRDKRYVRKDGNFIWVSISAAPFRDVTGRISNIIAAIQDITDRKQSEALIRQSLLNYQELVDSIDGIVWETTPNFQFTFVSKQAERILGYPVEQWKKEPHFWSDHIYPADREWAVQFCNERCVKLENHDFEYRMVASDGRIVWFRDIVHVIVKDGKVSGLKGVMVDSTEKKQIMDNLRDSEERFRGIFEQSLLSITLASVKGHIYAVNPAWRHLWGTPQEVLENYILNSYNIFRDPQLIKHGVIPYLEKALQGTASVIPEVFYDPAQSGSEGNPHWVESYLYPVKDRNGHIREIVIMNNDISERKLYAASRERMLAQETQARKEAERAVQLRDDFLSIAAHELRTPLTPIRMNVQLIKHHLQTLDPGTPKLAFLEKAAQETDREIERFLQLLENLLDVSRIHAGRLVLEYREFNISNLVKKVVERSDALLTKAQCKLYLDIQTQLIGRWDQERIEQVIVNLLNNAMKYGAKRPIEITVSGTKDKAFIQIKDHGIGMSKQDQKKIFHRFERVAPLKHFGGFGLGLFISQEIVQAHRGAIHIESELGKGATFTVELPL